MFLNLVKRWIDFTDHIDQVKSGFEGFLFANFHNFAGDAPGIFFFGITPKNPFHFICTCRIDPFCCGHACSIVHAHIQWAILLKTEPTVGLVNLWRRNTKVKQDAVKLHAGFCHFSQDLLKPTSMYRNPRIFFGHRLSHSDGFRVTIDHGQVT